MKHAVLAFLLLASLPQAAGAEDVGPTAEVRSIIASIEAINRFADVYSARLSVSSASPETPQPIAIEYILFARGLKSSLLICTAPKRDEGKRILLRNESLWMYFPKAKRSIIVHATNSLTGSLSVGDMVSPPLLDLYAFERAHAAEGGALLLSFTAKNSRVPYGRVVYRYENGSIVAQQSYTRSNILMKTITYEAFVQTDDGHRFASRVRVQNAVYPAYYSIIEIRNLKKVPTFPDFYFTPEGMESAHE